MCSQAFTNNRHIAINAMPNTSIAGIQTTRFICDFSLLEWSTNPHGMVHEATIGIRFGVPILCTS
jgi:hypothetical protein